MNWIEMNWSHPTKRHHRTNNEIETSLHGCSCPVLVCNLLCSLFQPRSLLWCLSLSAPPLSSIYSLASSDTEDKEQQIQSLRVTRIMSRCSLRLDDSRLDRSTGSLSVGGASWGSGRWVLSQKVPTSDCLGSFFFFSHFLPSSSIRLPKSRRSQGLSLSCSESVLRSTPRKPNTQSFHNSSVHSEASDASLLSLLLDESSIKEHTLVDSLWGKSFAVVPSVASIFSIYWPFEQLVVFNSCLGGPMCNICLLYHHFYTGKVFIWCP